MELQNKIMEILYDYDLDGLAQEDDTIDAYEDEAVMIYNFIMNNRKVNVINSTRLADQIQLVFITSLSIFPDISLCKGIALEILEYIDKEVE